MLLWLSDLLAQHFKGFGVFNYLTLRFVLSIITAFALSLWWGPWMID
ncbi:phospho-N-acetylmuramoyl-pentapeptide-transferase, partial [Acinetobacter baumannii]